MWPPLGVAVRAVGLQASMCSRGIAYAPAHTRTLARSKLGQVTIPAAGSVVWASRHRRHVTTTARAGWGAEGAGGLHGAPRPHTVLVDGSGVLWRSFYGLPALSEGLRNGPFIFQSLFSMVHLRIHLRPCRVGRVGTPTA